MTTTIAAEYHTKSGKVGAQVKRNESHFGVTFSYIGAWGAGGGHSALFMEALIGDWLREKRGFTVVKAFAD